MKSLALQTLQTEHNSLLQKLQRERAKTQAIEKKTTVADQEVNEVTGKNEELNDLVKILETQLEESEKKREAIRIDAAREKEQWGRMLDMSSRLHAKIDSERQKLLQENAALERRLLANRGVIPSSEGSSDHPGLTAATSGISVGLGHSDNVSEAERAREVALLTDRVESLRSVLETIKKHNSEFVDRSRGFLEQTTIAITQALEEGHLKSKLATSDARAHDAPSHATPPSSFTTAPSAQQAPTWSFNLADPSTTANPTSGTFEVFSNGKKSIARIAEVARAVSPDPDELGFHVVPSTSTPEELIRALGPVPVPLKSFQSIPRSDN